MTGATGELGHATIEHLVERVPPEHVVALARRPEQLRDVAERGVEVRAGDYADPESLVAAMEGIAKMLLISAPAFTDAMTSHRNAIEAAVAAGVAHVHYTAIQRRSGSGFVIPQITEWDRATEDALRASGLDVTILRNTLYLDSVDQMIGAPDRGVVRVPAGSAAAALAPRRDLAEATAEILAGDGHAGLDYTLSGSVPMKMEAGARFMAAWFRGIAEGEFAATGDLERILGRPTEPRRFLREARELRREFADPAAEFGP